MRGEPTQKRNRPKRSFRSAGKITPICGKDLKRSPRLAETAQRRPKVLPSCTSRATRATLPKTSQRGLPAYKYTYPVVVESTRGYKLGNRVQHGVTTGIGYTRRLPRRGSRMRATQTHSAYRDTTTLMTCVFDALAVTKDGCLLGEPFCRRPAPTGPTLPGPAPPPRPSISFRLLLHTLAGSFAGSQNTLQIAIEHLLGRTGRRRVE